MSIFGDLETPVAKTPEPAAKQLVDLSIKPHTQVQADGKGRVLIPVVQALLNPVKNTVGLRAETKTAFSDGTAGEGVTVTFFVNGQRLCDVKTDDFGVAVLDCQAPAGHFTFNHQTDELTARVRGFAKEASMKIQAFRHKIVFAGCGYVSYQWLREFQSDDPDGLLHRARFGGTAPKRFEHLIVRTKILKPEQSPMFLRDLDVVVALQRQTPQGEWRTLVTAKPSVDNGMVEISLEKYYWNIEERIPSEYNIRGLRLRWFPVNWPQDLVDRNEIRDPFSDRFRGNEIFIGNIPRGYV